MYLFYNSFLIKILNKLKTLILLFKKKFCLSFYVVIYFTCHTNRLFYILYKTCKANIYALNSIHTYNKHTKYLLNKINLKNKIK